MSLRDARGALTVTADDFAAFCGGAETLVSKQGRPALLRHEDPEGRVLLTKIWYPEGVLTTDRLVPYYRRFQRALVRLPELEVPAPRYRAHGTVTGGPERFVVYEPLPGEPLRLDYPRVDIDALGRFVCGLHEAGVYFRGLHLGNVIRCSDGGFGLIDVQDIRFFGGPLSRRRRERNLGALCAHPGDLPYMLEGHWSELVLAYGRAAGMSVEAAARLRGRVERQMEHRRARRAARRRRRGLAPLGVGEYATAESERAAARLGRSERV